MPAPIAIKIDVTKLKKDWFFKGKSGVFADLMLYENEQPDQYGNSHAVKQSPSKDAREAGEKAHYVGNGKRLERSGQAAAKPQQKTFTQPDDDGDSIPF